MQASEKRIATVSQINAYIKQLLDGSRALSDIWVRGEISNFKLHYSGHIYMTLKDEGGALKTVMFKSAAARLRFSPENGQKVLARGRVSVYERDGAYQLYVDEMQPDGVGALHLAFEQLKERLRKEGLFSEERKKELPRYPSRIGIVTSATGAALRDILNILKRRFKAADIYIAPVLVQGEQAAGQIAAAIELFNAESAADVLIVGRGGGSIEDLWAFNEEVVARAVAASRIPVISAVGHETDFTICDFAADKRAPTPSAAAEIATPSAPAVAANILSLKSRLGTALKNKTALGRQRLLSLSSSAAFARFSERFDDARFLLDNLLTRLERAAAAAITAKRERLKTAAAGLNALSPLSVLERGFSITTFLKGGIVKRAADVKTGERVGVLLGEGSLVCTVDEIRSEKNKAPRGGAKETGK